MVISPGVLGASRALLVSIQIASGAAFLGVFEFAAFVGDVPEVAVAAVDLGVLIDADRNVDVWPRKSSASSRETISHSRQGAMTGKSRCERFVSQFEADLVVTFARASVGECVAARGARYFYLLPG